MSTAVLVTFGLLALVMVWRWQFGFAAALAGFIVFRSIGLSGMVAEGYARPQTAFLFLTALGLFAFGYLTCSSVARRLPAPDVTPLRPLPAPAIWAVVLTAGLLGVYHLLAAGIPIFASSIERQRFDFTASGLFGVPGRMYLFGITMAWIAASANAQARNVAWRKDRAWRWATGFLVVTTLLSGFKGDLMSLIVTSAAILVIVTQRKITVGRAILKYWWLAALPVAYFVLIASLYPSYNTGEAWYLKIFDRLTVIPAEAIWIALEHRTVPFPKTPVLSDLSYFLQRYTGSESTGGYTFERAVSASIIGVDPASDAWTTPVTVSSFAELYASFGVLVAMLAQAISGAILGYGESAPQRTTLGVIGRAVIGVALFSWVVKGGLIYHLLNYGFVAAALLAVGLLTSALTFKPTSLAPKHLISTGRTDHRSSR